MVSNTRDKNIDFIEEGGLAQRPGRPLRSDQRPHVQPYPADKDFNTVHVQLIDRPEQ